MDAIKLITAIKVDVALVKVDALVDKETADSAKAELVDLVKDAQAMTLAQVDAMEAVTQETVDHAQLARYVMATVAV